MNLPVNSAISARHATGRSVAVHAAASAPAALARLAYAFVRRQFETVSVLRGLRHGEFRNDAPPVRRRDQ